MSLDRARELRWKLLQTVEAAWLNKRRAMSVLAGAFNQSRFVDERCSSLSVCLSVCLVDG